MEIIRRHRVFLQRVFLQTYSCEVPSKLVSTWGIWYETAVRETSLIALWHARPACLSPLLKRVILPALHLLSLKATVIVGRSVCMSTSFRLQTPTLQSILNIDGVGSFHALSSL